MKHSYEVSKIRPTNRHFGYEIRATSFSKLSISKIWKSIAPKCLEYLICRSLSEAEGSARALVMYDEEFESLSLGAFLWHALILYLTLLFCIIRFRHIREHLFVVHLLLFMLLQ